MSSFVQLTELAPVIRRVRTHVAQVLPNELARRRATWGDDDAAELVLIAELANREMALVSQDRVRGGHPALDPDDVRAVVEEVVAWQHGAGGLERFLREPDIENIDVNGFDNVWLSWASGVRELGPPIASSDDELVELVRQIASRLGLHEQSWDPSNPLIDVQLPDGSRLYAVLGGRTVRGVAARPSLSIRRHRVHDVTLEQLAAGLPTPPRHGRHAPRRRPLQAVPAGPSTGSGMLTPAAVRFLVATVRAGCTILVAGAPDAGKTTFLRSLIHVLDHDRRIVTVEKGLLELGLHTSALHTNVAALYSRAGNLDGYGEVTVAQLVRATLRMHPEVVVVGEVLGDEVIPMLQAMSQGVQGFATIHAHSPRQTINRLAQYALSAPEHQTPDATMVTVAQSIDFVVYLSADEDESGVKRRRVAEILEVGDDLGDGRVSLSSIFKTDPFGNLVRESAVESAIRRRRLERAGWDDATGVVA